MAEVSRPWSGTTIGDAGPYTDQNWQLTWRSFLQVNALNEGVFKDQLNEFVTTGAASPISVASGRALVRGVWYDSDAAVAVAVPSPAVATRIDRIVARADFAAQTVRITRVAGVEGGGAPPALVQIDGTTWDIPLYQASITVPGVITLTSERDFIGQGGAARTLYTAIINEMMAG